MRYAQLNQDGSYGHEITTIGNVEWDTTHYCPAAALTAEEAAIFRIVPLLETSPPAFDAITHSCQRNGGELVNGEWQYKWDVVALDAVTIAANLAKTEANRIESLWNAAHDLEYANINGSAVGLVTMGILQSLPKCLAVQTWITSIWTLYYARKASGSTDVDYSVCGPMPCTIPELMTELGIG